MGKCGMSEWAIGKNALSSPSQIHLPCRVFALFSACFSPFIPAFLLNRPHSPFPTARSSVSSPWRRGRTMAPSVTAHCRWAIPCRASHRCYTYGTFDFDQPNFYLNFCRGKLLYYLNVERHRDFEYGNLMDRRSMQNECWCDQTQKQRLFKLLQENARPENASYKYDFFYDNCAPRPRHGKHCCTRSRGTTTIRQGTTMRQLLPPLPGRQALDAVRHRPACWARRPTGWLSPKISCFCPITCTTFFSATKLPDGQPLIRKELKIPPQGFAPSEWRPGWLDHPLLITSLITLYKVVFASPTCVPSGFNPIFWFVLGFGLVMFLLWVATDHSATKTNWNLLWALPTHLLFFWRRSKSELVENYFTGASILAGRALVFWKFIPQELPMAAMPLAGLVAVQGAWRRFWKKEKVVVED